MYVQKNGYLLKKKKKRYKLNKVYTITEHITIRYKWYLIEELAIGISPGNIKKHFISLADYREKRINKILDI